MRISDWSSDVCSSDLTDFETSVETSVPGRAERLDVIETAGGKRRWTPEARARIIAESLEPGANVSAVARRHGLFPQQLYTRSEEHTSELQSLMRSSYAVFCLKKKTKI